MQRRAGAEEQDRLVRRGLAHRVGEERDRLELVGLDDRVVVGEVLLRHPVGVERRVAAAQERAGQAGEPVLVGGGAEVRAAQEHDRVAGGDGVADQRGAERAGVVRRLLGELGGDVAGRAREPAGARAPAAQRREVVRGLRERVGARPGLLEQRPVRAQVAAQAGAPGDVGEGEEAEQGEVRRTAQDARGGERRARERGDGVERVGRHGGGAEGGEPAPDRGRVEGGSEHVHGQVLSDRGGTEFW